MLVVRVALIVELLGEFRRAEVERVSWVGRSGYSPVRES